MASMVFLRLINLNIVKGVPLARVASFLNQIKTTKESAVLTEKLGDLYSDLGKPSSAVEMWQRALELDPSPEQRVRLRLDLAKKLVKLDQNQDAVEDLSKLLQENPDYPAKLDIYKKLLPLAKKLGKTEAAENYEKRIQELSAN
jgi:tetratricopeptide (TPR) repeat protein